MTQPTPTPSPSSPTSSPSSTSPSNPPASSTSTPLPTFFGESPSPPTTNPLPTDTTISLPGDSTKSPPHPTLSPAYQPPTHYRRLRKVPPTSALRGLSLLTSPTRGLTLHLEWTHSTVPLTVADRNDLLAALDYLRSYILTYSHHPSPLLSLTTEPPMTPTPPNP